MNKQQLREFLWYLPTLLLLLILICVNRTKAESQQFFSARNTVEKALIVTYAKREIKPAQRFRYKERSFNRINCYKNYSYVLTESFICRLEKENERNTRNY